MKCQRGFTLLETLVTLVIVGILLGVGNMGFRSLQRSIQGRQASGEIVEALQDARGRAVAGQRRIGVVFDLASRRNLMFADSAADGIYNPNSKDKVLAGWKPMENKTKLSVRVASKLTNGRTWCHVVFEPDGRSSSQMDIISKWEGGSRRIVLVPITGMVHILSP